MPCLTKISESTNHEAQKCLSATPFFFVLLFNDNFELVGYVKCSLVGFLSGNNDHRFLLTFTEDIVVLDGGGSSMQMI